MHTQIMGVTCDPPLHQSPLHRADHGSKFVGSAAGLSAQGGCSSRSRKRQALYLVIGSSAVQAVQRSLALWVLHMHSGHQPPPALLAVQVTACMCSL